VLTHGQCRDIRMMFRTQCPDVDAIPDRMLQPHAREAGFFGAQHGRGR
jgi:hypothetical protein